jgi:hypothetical protein
MKSSRMRAKTDNAKTALAAKTLPDLQRAVKWGMAYYGVAGGWSSRPVPSSAM